MGLFKKLFHWKKKKEEPELASNDWSEITYDRQDYQIENKDQRQEYVKGCLEQIAEASKELENLQLEYNMVTSSLKDIEEIEALSEEDATELRECAKKIDNLERQQTGYEERKNRMSEEEFRELERMEDEFEEGYEKLTKAEDYQDLVKRDLRKLDGERQAYYYRRSELRRIIADTKSMTIVCTVAVILCILILFVLQYGFRMDTKLGYLAAAAVGAIAITAIFVKHNDSIKELGQVENGISRIINLQNTVKIRYVNNTHLLDYLYFKYNVSSAGELGKNWKRYEKEKEERRIYQIAIQELGEWHKELIDILRYHKIADPMVWLHQVPALLDKKEMVEVRHSLIIRRQTLRKRMDYNKEVIAGKAQAEVKDLVESYPEYAQEILDIVGQYEQDFS
ncbi:hypothetical protein [Parablautia muri]|uniref:Uncharacterized protein n=1 Tax=Parablautia muri TaxID=2320879 RepID=A0A9X5BGC3_9FIRM|nr:hypothetical protein [Parablautia muri]NBJ93122.1 hypothetical protein [Parablautia muri]